MKWLGFRRAKLVENCLWKFPTISSRRCYGVAKGGEADIIFAGSARKIITSRSEVSPAGRVHSPEGREELAGGPLVDLQNKSDTTIRGAHRYWLPSH